MSSSYAALGNLLAYHRQLATSCDQIELRSELTCGCNLSSHVTLRRAHCAQHTDSQSYSTTNPTVLQGIYLISRDRHGACCENRVTTERRYGSTLGTASSDLTGFRSSSVKLDSSPIHPEMGCTITLCHQNSAREAHDLPILAAVYFTYRRGLRLRITLACGRSASENEKTALMLNWDPFGG